MSEKQPLIDSVPGVVGDGEPTSAEKPNVDTIPAAEFKGDPSKVLGHPSNPNTALFSRISEALLGEDNNTTAPENPAVTPEISSVPSAEDLAPLSPPENSSPSNKWVPPNQG